jgi:hypothetical protein
VSERPGGRPRRAGCAPRTAHPALDEEQSWPFLPVYRHGRRELLTLGTIYEVDVEILPTGLVLSADCALTLDVQGHDYSNSGDRADHGSDGWKRILSTRPPTTTAAPVTPGHRRQAPLLPDAPRHQVGAKHERLAPIAVGIEPTVIGAVRFQ